MEKVALGKVIVYKAAPVGNPTIYALLYEKKVK